MKRTVSIVVLVISVMVVMSCRSTGRQVTGTGDDAFRGVYNEYWSDLNLDGAQKYTVKSGDRLVDISRDFYQDPYYYPLIMLASKDIVLDPDKIQPGMVLTIPDLDKNLNGVRSKANVKGVILDCAQIEENRGRADTARGLRERANRL
ncbi:MAG: LysM peptidoglycan-binding domain-containing protein [Treponema sp.]|jgi:hypothetical protein|nr:LysM peptidoglycan-binding domain-containing protein [Treponema sp.]